jgi:TP901 family phage tail tape measure protein
MAGSVKIKIQALSKYKKAFDGISRAFGRIKKLALGASGAIKGMFKHMFSVRSMLAGGGIVAGLVATVKQSQNFALQMARVHTMLQKGDISAFTEDVRELSAELGLTKDELARGLYQVLSAGVPRENAIEFLTVASRAAVAGVTDVETAVDGLTTVTNAYGRANLSVQRASDIMFATIYKGKTTFPELSQFIGQLTGLAAKAGISFEELGGAIASVAKQGIQTDKAVVGLRQAIVNLLRPSTELAALYEKMGVTGGEMLKRHGLVESLKLIEEAAGGNIDMISAFIQNIRALPAVLALTGKSADITADAMEFVEKSVDEMMKAFGKVDKIRGWSKLFQSAHNVLVRLGDVVNVAVMPAITRMAAAIAGFAESDRFDKRLAGWTGKLREFATATEGFIKVMRFGDEAQREMVLGGFSVVLSAMWRDAGNALLQVLYRGAMLVGFLIAEGWKKAWSLGGARREAMRELRGEKRISITGPSGIHERKLEQSRIDRREAENLKRELQGRGDELAAGMKTDTTIDALKNWGKLVKNTALAIEGESPLAPKLRQILAARKAQGQADGGKAAGGLAQYGITAGGALGGKFQSTDLAEIFNRAFGDVLTGANKKPTGAKGDEIYVKIEESGVTITEASSSVVR